MTAPLRTVMRPFGISMFSRVSDLAAEHRVINLAQGVPDFPAPPALVEAAATAMRQHINQYAPSPGLASLRAAVSTHAKTRYGVSYDPDTEVTVTAGATEAIWSTAAALLEPGDEAIVIEPYYETYPPSVVAAGGVVRFVPTTFPDFLLDLERLAAACNPRTRLIFLNTPGNPSGRSFTAEELRGAAELAERYDAYLVCDETYEHLTYDGRAHRRVSSVPECRERSVIISSASKTFGVTGWRVGWTLASHAVTDAIRRVHQFVTFAAPSPLQQAVATMLDDAPRSGYFDELARGFTVRRDLLLDYLRRSGLEVAVPDAGYFVMARCRGDDLTWCEDLIRRPGVAALPGSAFYHDRTGGRDLVRFAFCKAFSTLHAAGARMLRP